MPVNSATAAPYAPAAAILDVIKRHRTRGLPSPVDSEVLGRAGVPESLLARTLQAMKTLDLLDAEGRPTETFEGLRLAPEAGYVDRLGQWLNGAYADVLKFVDPATASETDLRDAFRSYTPIGQQARMVTLFTGLYAAAGIGPEKEGSPRSVRRGAKTSGSTAPVNAGGAPKRPSQGDAKPAPEVKPAKDPDPAAEGMSDKALEYKLVDLLKNQDIADEQRAAIWSLIQYLAGRSRSALSPADGG